eukprot:sb/3464603/
MILLLLCAIPAILASQPSFIAISLTQVGWADLNLPLWFSETPNIQSLASRSISLNSLYCETSPSASHGAFLTGRDPVSWGFYSSNNAEATNLKEDSGFVLPLPTLATTLSNHTSHFVGRWWLGQRPEANPTNHGFDSFYGYVSDRGTKYDDLRYPNPGLYRNTEIQSRLYDTTNPSLDLIQDEGRSNLTELFAEEAVRFLRSTTSQPYYLHLSLDATQHPAYRCPQYEGNSTTRGGHFADALREIDGLVGRVLEEAGDDIIVALFADSTALASHFDGGSNAPFTGESGDSTEGGVRVPGFLYIPAEIGRRSNQVMTLSDLHIIISSLLRGESQELPNAFQGIEKTVPIFRGRTLMALRWRQYKAHVNMLSNYVPGQFVDSLTSFSFKYIWDWEQGVDGQLRQLSQLSINYYQLLKMRLISSVATHELYSFIIFTNFPSAGRQAPTPLYLIF